MFQPYEGCQPPLDEESQWAVAAIPSGAAFHLSLASVVCNSLHRNSGPMRMVDCSTCRFQTECRREITDTLVFAARMARAREQPSSRGGEGSI